MKDLLTGARAKSGGKKRKAKQNNSGKSKTKVHPFFYANVAGNKQYLELFDNYFSQTNEVDECFLDETDSEALLHGLDKSISYCLVVADREQATRV